MDDNLSGKGSRSEKYNVELSDDSLEVDYSSLSKSKKERRQIKKVIKLHEAPLSKVHTFESPDVVK